jgi:AraC family transcriptional regulator
MIGEAIIVYLAQQYSPTASSKQPLTGGLPKLRLRRVLEYIHGNLEHDIHLDELAAAAGLSSFHFAKLFKQSTGVTPHQYVLQRRLERAKELLRNPEISLTQASLQSGFADQSHLTNVFRRFVGVTPSRFRALL